MQQYLKWAALTPSWHSCSSAMNAAMNESKPPTWTQTENVRGKQPTRLTRPHTKQRAHDFLLSSLAVHPAARDDDDDGGGGVSGSGQL